MTYAKIIADSVSPEGVRLTTFEVRFHRFVLAEFNTHRVFSRNSASSRAIPLAKQIQRIETGLAYPVAWPKEQKGMQGGEPVSDEWYARQVWAESAQAAIRQAGLLSQMPVEGGEEALHKSVVNRILEPFMWHTAVVTATAWDNFFAQRCSPLAQPEIRVAAEAMQTAYNESKPMELGTEEWHAPYISEAEWASTMDSDDLVKIAAARCARVSYLTQDGKRDTDADLTLYDRLVTAQPAHWSPLEHVATPWPQNRQVGPLYWGPGNVSQTSTDHLPRVGNLLGWRSLRTEVETEQGRVTYS